MIVTIGNKVYHGYMEESIKIATRDTGIMCKLGDSK